MAKKIYKHPDIIDDPAKPEEPLLLAHPSSDQYKKMMAVFENSYTKEALVKIAQEVASEFAEANIAYPGPGGRARLNVEISKVQSATTAKKKEFFVDVMAQWLCCEQNFSAYIQILKPKKKRFMMMLCSTGMLSAKTATDILGIEAILDTPRYYWSQARLSSNVPGWAVANKTSDPHTVNLMLPASIRPWFFNAYFPPEPMAEITLSQLPDDEKLTIFSDEKDAVKNVSIFRTLHKNGLLELGATKMVISVARKLNKLVGLKEFLPDAEKELSVWRTLMFAGTLAYVYNDKKISASDAPRVIKAAIFPQQQNISQTGSFVRHMLPYYKWTASHHVVNSLREELAAATGEILTKVPAGQWLRINDFVKEFMRTQSMALLFDIFSITYESQSLIANKYDDLYVTPLNFKQQLGVPMLQSYLAFLASFGCVEIAWQDAEKGDPSPLSRMRYVRLTRLGRYVFGLDKQYEMEPTEKSVDEQFEVSDTHLLFRPLSQKNPYIGIIKDFADPVGAGRYKVTQESFLRQLDNVDDLKARIRLFKELVCERPPKNWEDFFKTLLSHTDVFVPIKEYLAILKIAPNQQELMRLVSTDPELRKIVIRAEQGYIMLNRLDVNKLSALLRSHGYLW